MTVLLRITILLAIAAVVLTGCGGKGAKDGAGTFTDTRDGKVYRSVKIAGQVWMAENLNFAAEGSVCYDSSESNCATYGRLYVLDAAKASCPAGWRLPSTDEWTALIEAVGGRWERGHWYGVYSALKAAGGWKDDGGNGSDSFGFSALPSGGGELDGGRYVFSGIGVNGEWWSTDQVLLMEGGTVSNDGDYVRWFDNGLASVRCLRDDGSGKFTDSRDGKAYRYATVGNRVWMAENLNYKGDRENTLGRCYEDKEENCAKYGRLYPLYESKEICPTGWRLPIDADWAALRDAAGGEKAGKKLKSPAGWKGKGNGTDDYGFAALPGGYGGWDKFGEAGENGYWWSATLSGISDAVSVLSYFRMQFNEDYVGGGDEYGDGARYFSVRCVRESDDKEVMAALEANAKREQEISDDWSRRVEEIDAEAAGESDAEEQARQTDGEASGAVTFTDSRDGKAYKIIKAGSQTWMAENLNYAAEGSKCYENNAGNCEKYGRLYDWATALKACPAGWRLSSEEEWAALLHYAGAGVEYGEYKAGTKLKSSKGWESYKGVPTGTNDYGFSALPGGNGGSDGDFGYADSSGYWWSATEGPADGAWGWRMNYVNEGVLRDSYDKANLFSVRCVVE